MAAAAREEGLQVQVADLTSQLRAMAQQLPAPAPPSEPPHLLWERLQELTASELQLRQRVQEAEAELEVAGQRCRSLAAQVLEHGETEGQLRLQLTSREVEIQVGGTYQ